MNKIIGFFICILLIATFLPGAESLKSKNSISPIPIRITQTPNLGNWTEIQKLLASDGSPGDGFGSVSIDGNYALIGARNNIVNGISSGSAYIFFRNGSKWKQQAELFPSDGMNGELFGESVSLSGDTALIGAPLYGSGDYIDMGTAYVFTRSGTNWTQQQKLTAPYLLAQDEFGISVSLKGDTALIGAQGKWIYGPNSGAAYIFTRTGSTWAEQLEFYPTDGASWDLFGCSVALGDNELIVGAYGDLDNGYYSGSAYVFKHYGPYWLQTKLLPSDGRRMDLFGISVSIDGNYTLVGAERHDGGNGYYSGSAYLFMRTESNNWTQKRELIALDGAEYDYFGCSVSLQGDTALIGSPYNKNNGIASGSAYVFTRDETNWTQKDKLFQSDGKNNSIFGCLVSLDNNTALIGAPYDNNSVGAAYIFNKNKNQPPNQPIINGPNWGLKNTNYLFSINASDSEGDNVYCNWDWGDGNVSGWLGPYKSGEIIQASHSWGHLGNSTLRIQLKDIHGAVSDWSPLFFLTIVQLNTAFFLGIFDNISQTGDLMIFQARLFIVLPSNHLFHEGGTVAISKEYLGHTGKQFTFGVGGIAILSPSP